MPSHERIKAQREALGLSISQAARELMKYLPGVDQSDWSKIERGLRKVKADEIPAFATVLRCRRIDLIDPKPNGEND